MGNRGAAQLATGGHRRSGRCARPCRSDDRHHPADGAPREEVRRARTVFSTVATLTGRLAATSSNLFSRSAKRPFIMATVLETVLDLRPDSPFAADLIRKLLASRRPHSGIDAVRMLWCQKADDRLADPEPSVVHT